MNCQESFEQHWAEVHDLPVETLAQYRWKDRDGYNLPGIADGYRNFCAGWDANSQNAGRYEWLRDVADNADWEYLSHQNPEETDQWIDARMKP